MDKAILDSALPLNMLETGATATVCSIGTLDRSTEKAASSKILEERLQEMGFVPGTVVKKIHRSTLPGGPATYEVRGTLIALRQVESNLIFVTSHHIRLEQSGKQNP